MANFFAKLLSPAFGGLVNGVADIVDRFTMDKEEKAEFMLKLEMLAQQAESELEQTMRAELQAKERILVAELNQGDNYTKRARPTVVYVGLGAIIFNYCITPLTAWIMSEFGSGYISPLPEMMLPTEFWYAWGGVVATWTVSRTMERRGSNNNLVKVVTGENARPSLLD